MDLDDDGFDDLEFNPDDLQLLDKTEQYYSSQMNIDNMTTSASFIPPSSNVNMSSQINMKDVRKLKRKHNNRRDLKKVDS